MIKMKECLRSNIITVRSPEASSHPFESSIRKNNLGSVPELNHTINNFRIHSDSISDKVKYAQCKLKKYSKYAISNRGAKHEMSLMEKAKQRYI